MSVLEFAPFTRSGPGLLLSVSSEHGSTIVAVRGEIDIATVPTLMDVLVGVIADRDGNVIVDLAEAQFIDSSTVRALARAGTFLAERGRLLTVRSPSRLAARVLSLHGLLHLVAV